MKKQRHIKCFSGFSKVTQLRCEWDWLTSVSFLTLMLKQWWLKCQWVPATTQWVKNPTAVAQFSVEVQVQSLSQSSGLKEPVLPHCAVGEHDFILFYFLSFEGCTHTAYGSSQPLGRIRCAAASLHHSCSQPGSKPRWWPTPQLTAILDP